MLNAENFIKEIYGATAEPGVWLSLIPQLAPIVGGHATSIGTGRVGDLFSHKLSNNYGTDPTLLKRYNDIYDPANPWIVRAHQASLTGRRKFAGAPVRVSEFIKPEEMHRTPVYNESLVPLDTIDCTVFPLHNDKTFCALYVFCGKRKQQFSDRDYQIATRIAGHVRKSYETMSSLGPLASFFHGEDVLAVSTPAIVVSADLRVLAYNCTEQTHIAFQPTYGGLTDVFIGLRIL